MKARIAFSIALVVVGTSLIHAQTTAEEYFQLGLESYRVRDYESAFLYFEKTIEADPKHASAYMMRASIRGGRRDYQGAIADYTKVIELEPTKKQRYSNRALMHFYAGNADAAIADYTKEIEIGGYKKHSYHWMGRVYEDKAWKLIRLGQVESGRSERARAILFFTKAIALDPKDAEPYCDRSIVHSRNRDFALALADINAALAIRPTFVDFYRLRIEIYRSTGRHDLAEADEKKIAELAGK